MDRIEKNEGFLKALSSSHVKQAKALIKTAKTKQLDAICEIILNVIKEVIVIPKTLFKKAKKYKKIIRRLAEKTLGRKLRRKLMAKYIPILQSILSSALPILSFAISAAQF
jgi:hypothetical protein